MSDLEVRMNKFLNDQKIRVRMRDDFFFLFCKRLHAGFIYIILI